MVRMFWVSLSAVAASETLLSPLALQALTNSSNVLAENEMGGVMAFPLEAATVQSWQPSLPTLQYGITAITADAGYVYGVRIDGLWKVSAGGGSWSNIAGRLVIDSYDIAVDGGVVYGIGTNQHLYSVPADGGSWTEIAGCCVTDIAVNGGVVYAVGTNQHLYTVPADGGSWTEIAGCCVTDIAVDGGVVYGIGTDQHLYSVPADGGSWTEIAGCCVNDITARSGYVYGVGNDHGVWRTSSDGGSWSNIAGCCVHHIAVDAGSVYGIGNDQGVYDVPGGEAMMLAQQPGTVLQSSWVRGLLGLAAAAAMVTSVVALKKKRTLSDVYTSFVEDTA